jgi:general stress protein YciG
MTNQQHSAGKDETSKQSGSGNLGNDKDRASEAGKKGGQQHRGTSQADQSGSGRSQQGSISSDDSDDAQSTTTKNKGDKADKGSHQSR